MNEHSFFVQEIRNSNLEIRNNDQNPKWVNDKNIQKHTIFNLFVLVI